MMFLLNGEKIILTQTGPRRLVVMIVVALATVLDSLVVIPLVYTLPFVFCVLAIYLVT
jgi:hypothetical protein